MTSVTKTLELIKAKGGIDEAIEFCQNQIEVYGNNGWLPSVIAMWDGHLSNLLKMKRMGDGDQ